MKQVKDVEAEPSPSAGTGGGGTSAPDKVWTISGRLRVRESEIDGEPHDRPLKGIEVKVSARDTTIAPWTSWGTVRTDADGDFTLHEANNGKSRFLRVRARLVGGDLEVNDSKLDDLASFDLLDENWRTVWESNGQARGPRRIDRHSRLRCRQPFDLGDPTLRRQALIWYVLRTAIDRLEDEDPWFAMNGKIAAIYPAHVVSDLLGPSQSYANGLTRMIYLNQGQPDTHWHPDVVLHEFMHLWNYDHNTGTTNWVGALCSGRGNLQADLSTHGYQENPNVAFHEGFAYWASNALLHELWGLRLNKPFNRREIAANQGLTTLEMVEQSDQGVESALRLLRCDERQGWWSHLFGTSETYPDNQPDDNANGVPDYPDEVGVKKRLDGRQVPSSPNSLSLWDILRTFRATPADGWSTDWQVGNVDYGVVRFIDRAVDIHNLGEDVRLMLKRCIDPLATDEPYEALPKT